MPSMSVGKSWLAPAWLMGAVPLTATLLPKGMVVLLAIVGLLAIAEAWRRRALPEMFPKWALALALVAFAWMAFRAVYTFDGIVTLDRLPRYFGLIVLGFAAVWWVRTQSPAERAVAGKALLFGAFVALAVVVVGAVIVKLDVHQRIPIERADRLSIFNTGTIALILLAPSIVFQMSRSMRKIWIVLFCVALLGVSFFIGSSSSYMAALIGIGVAGIVLKFGRPFAQLLSTLCVAGIVAFPMALPLTMDRLDVTLVQDGDEQTLVRGYDFVGSLGHRYFIWRFALARAEERPFLGWGFDASRSLPGGHETIDIGKELMPLHPHNEILQVWLELGVPGLLILAAVVWFLYRPPESGRGLIPGSEWVRTSTVAMMFAVICVAFGIWQSWWVASMIMILAVIHLSEKPAEDA